MGSTRALAWFAIAAQFVFVATWIVAGGLEDGYSHLDHHVSELGADGAANPWLMNAGIVVLGLGIAALAPILLRTLPRRPASRVAAGLFLAAGLTVVVAGIFNADCSTAVDATCQQRWDDWTVDTAAKIHGWGSLVSQALLAATPFALARALWNRPVSAPLLAGGLIGIGLGIAMSFLFAVDNAPDGLTQRLGLAVLHFWVIQVAIGVLWATRRPPTVPATPIRPSEFFSTAWAGEGELVPWPAFLWRRWPQRIRIRRESTFLNDEIWYFDDSVWRDSGELIHKRRIFLTLVSPDRALLTSDWLLDGTEVLLEEGGYRIQPYRVAVPVGPIHFGVSVRDTATVHDGMLVNHQRISWFGLPVARAELRARPEPKA
jgi:hypothetical protein